MEKWAFVLVFVLGCGGETNRMADAGGFDAGRDAMTMVIDAGDAGHDSGVDSGHDGGICVNANPCPVTWSECQTRTCSETLGCGPVANIREGFDCSDDNASTYGDECSSGACVGTPLACTVNNGGCGTATCIGNDPAPPTCQCSSRYNVTASEVMDTTTGLVWQRTASASTFTHANALTHCSGMGGGWRVPTKGELEGIVTGIVGPRIDACAFPGASSSIFWVSTAYPGMPGVYWAVNFASGSTPGGATGDTGTTPHLVRCVR
jgi:hypothetical protein